MPQGRRRWGIGGIILALAAATPAVARQPPAHPARSAIRGAGVRPTGHTRSGDPVIRIYPDEPAGPPLLGLGVEWDPYDTFRPTPADWRLTFSRVAFMQPGFIRVVVPASAYFKGYDAAHDPMYKWHSRHLRQLLRILSFAQGHGIGVVLGDWGDPIIRGDVRIPADFIAELRDVYGFTNIRYYDPINEPNYSPRCDFTCWTGVMRTLATEFRQTGMSSWLQLTGPDNGNSWDDTASAWSLDHTVGLDGDNPITDVWVTDTLQSIPGLIGAYDSHRYATIWGIEHGVYGDQMRSRREEISNLDSPVKPYFEGEAGMVARQVNPFAQGITPRQRASVAALIDPSASAAATTFVDSQPHIRQFSYGVWMGDMAIQAIDGGLSGASAWDLDDAMHVGGGYGSQGLKRWGFWNSFGGSDGYPASDLKLRPWYYTWSLLSRSFPAGSQALTVPSANVPGLRVAAARIPYQHRLGFSFALVNEANTPRAVRLVVPFLTGRLTLDRYDYFQSDRPADVNGFPTPARTLTKVGLSRGLLVELPVRGLVVLSSIPAQSSTAISGAGRTLLDDLEGWGKVYRRSRRLRLDRSNPLYFNGDPSRATPSAKHNQYLIYRQNGMTSFELKVYSAARPGLRVFRSSAGTAWAPVGLARTEPAPTVGGHGWCLDELLPARPLPAGTNQLRIEFTNPGTELSQVRIQYGRR